MSSLNEQVVSEALSWIGTPFHHQASVKGVGADCLGLVRGVWRQLNGHEPFSIPAYTQTWDEVEKSEVLWSGLAKTLVSDPEIKTCAGHVLLFRMRLNSVARHVGISSKSGRCFVHSYHGQGVVESALTQSWQRRIVASFSFAN